MSYRLLMETRMRESTKLGKLLSLVFAYGVFGTLWCFANITALRASMSHVRRLGGTVNNILFYTGTGIASLSLAGGILCGQLARRRKSLRASVAIGFCVGVGAWVIGMAVAAVLAIRLP